MNESAKIKYLQEPINSNINIDINIPKFFNYHETDKVNYMIMELLNFNIEELFNICGKCFTLKTLTNLGIQTVRLI
jgi:hypothetical protein